MHFQVVLDNTCATYLTDYAVVLVSVLSCRWLIKHITENKEARETLITQYSKWLPWNWPDVELCPVTLMTYMVLMFCSSLAVTALIGGIVHQVLIEVCYNIGIYRKIVNVGTVLFHLHIDM